MLSSDTTRSVSFEAVLISSITDASLSDDLPLLKIDLVDEVRDAAEFAWLLIVDSDDSDASKKDQSIKVAQDERGTMMNAMKL